ncbi:hypothetical protein BU16DRAFT_557701 [Lophium mytilinum]|uniref:Uncharacterized protein n=1 Tax=Lophium mytilinum TaxID=390894 RepID=A0A6A6R3T1_9PEZI|nr:hypothetical protein BU16DRAFT_557701 [Lophium mytilinum]
MPKQTQPTDPLLLPPPPCPSIQSSAPASRKTEPSPTSPTCRSSIVAKPQFLYVNLSTTRPKKTLFALWSRPSIKKLSLYQVTEKCDAYLEEYNDVLAVIKAGQEEFHMYDKLAWEKIRENLRLRGYEVEPELARMTGKMEKIIDHIVQELEGFKEVQVFMRELSTPRPRNSDKMKERFEPLAHKTSEYLEILKAHLERELERLAEFPSDHPEKQEGLRMGEHN